MSISEIYWLTRLPSLHTTFCVLSLLLALLIIIAFIAWTSDTFLGNSKLEKRFEKSFLFLIAFEVLALFAVIIIPTKNDLAVIFALHYTTNSEIPKKLESAIANYLDVEIEELKNKIKEGEK